MNPFQRAAVIVGYEWRRALAKKRVLVLIVLAIAFQTLIFAVFSQFPDIILTGRIRKTMWVLGILSGQSLFVPLMTILVGGGSLSEEYERGTADILLSKPIARVEYMAGKFLGGFSLVSFVEAITTIMGVALAYAFFGPQKDILYAPLLLASVMYSTFLFYSLTFMLSEVLRGSTLAMLVGFGILVVSSIVGNYLLFLHTITQEQLYMDISRLLPTWSATTLPTSLAADLMELPLGMLLPLSGGDVALAAAMVAIYTVIFVLITYFRIVRSDVTKKPA